MGFNKAILIGRLVQDPELRQTPSGVAVCAFRIAVDRDYTPKGGERQADFLDVVAWRERGEFVSRYFSKGKLILVEGSIQSRNYTDKNDQKRTAVEVIAEKVSFVGPKDSGGDSGDGYRVDTPTQEAFEEVSDEGDLPF